MAIIGGADMTRPQIATILDDGTYGQRDATDEEITELEANGYGTATDDEPDPPRAFPEAP